MFKFLLDDVPIAVELLLSGAFGVGLDIGEEGHSGLAGGFRRLH